MFYLVTTFNNFFLCTKYYLNKIFAKFNDNTNELIPLDSFVKIMYPLERFESVIKIPETALFNKQYIFVIKNGRAKKMQVKTGKHI